MSKPSELSAASSRFKKKLEERKLALGPQDFEWYPYDSFGNLVFLDSLIKGNIDLLRAIAGEEPLLDAGCGDGALSFFMESLGCRVEAIDNPPTNHNGMRGVRRLAEAMGSTVKIHQMDIDAQFQLPSERYGLTLLLGILYHLKNPFYVLETLAQHSYYCMLGTRVARVSPKGAAMRNEALAYLVDETETNGDETNFWIFSEEGLRRIMRRAGWEIREFMTVGCMENSDPVRGDRDERAICVLESRLLEPRYAPVLGSGWHDMRDGWRWTARDFSVSLNANPWIAPRMLQMRFILHEAVVARLGAITISATVNGRRLDPATFPVPGEHVYSAKLPPGATLPAPARVGFQLDKALPADLQGGMEMGLMVVFERTTPTAISVTEFLLPIRFV